MAETIPHPDVAARLRHCWQSCSLPPSRWLCVVAVAGVALSAGCKRPPAEAGIPPRKVADLVHAVIQADRTVYAREIVDRLQDQEKVIQASERFRQEKKLPLPAQMMRMGAEQARASGAEFTYSLLSAWPVNPKNAPRTDAEKAGLTAVAKNPAQPHYQEETLGGRRYLTAVYADVAVADACVTCHNAHKDSPRSDFKRGEVMGGVVIRIPLE